MIIGILGNKRAGKDTTADYICENYKNYEKYNFANPLKEACKIIFLLSDEQVYGNKKEELDERWNTTPRKILQYVGTELFRDRLKYLEPSIGNNVWVKHLNLKYKNNKNNIVVADVRNINEAEYIKKNNGIVIKIIRENSLYSASKPIDNHASEYINNVPYDYLIKNDSDLNNLYKKIDIIMTNNI